jgi:uncharacterized protein (DUF433 family)
MSTTVRIVTTPDVLHGKPRIEGTRVGVLQVGTAVRDQDRSIPAVAEMFDLDEEQVRGALDYYDEHPDLMETLRTRKEARYQAIRNQSRADEASATDPD